VQIEDIPHPQLVKKIWPQKVKFPLTSTCPKMLCCQNKQVGPLGVKKLVMHIVGGIISFMLNKIMLCSRLCLLKSHMP